KVGDQWNFFGTKRNRGVSFETSADLLMALSEAEQLRPDQLLEAAQRLTAELQNGARQAEQLDQVLKTAKPDLGSMNGPIQEAVHRLLQVAGRKVKKDKASKIGRASCRERVEM